MAEALSVIYSQPAPHCFMVNNCSCLTHHCYGQQKSEALGAEETMILNPPCFISPLLQFVIFCFFCFWVLFLGKGSGKFSGGAGTLYMGGGGQKILEGCQMRAAKPKAIKISKYIFHTFSILLLFLIFKHFF